MNADRPWLARLYVKLALQVKKQNKKVRNNNKLKEGKIRSASTSIRWWWMLMQWLWNRQKLKPKIWVSYILHDKQKQNFNTELKNTWLVSICRIIRNSQVTSWNHDMFYWKDLQFDFSCSQITQHHDLLDLGITALLNRSWKFHFWAARVRE